MILELQTDTWVKIAGVNTKLTAQLISDINAGTKTYTAIAITETWLTDFGLTKYIDEVGVVMFQLLDKNVYIYLSPIRQVADIYFGNELMFSVDCVHQVQNVVHSLIGEMITK